MRNILCPTIIAASLLAQILDLEGHTAVWYRFTDGVNVATTAPVLAVMDALSMVESTLGVPAARRTVAL
jgi:hypothetical protein